MTTWLPSKPPANLGTISLDVHRLSDLVFGRKMSIEAYRNKDDVATQKVHESAKKAVVIPHQVIYGEKCPREEDKRIYYESVDYRSKVKVVKFIFQYRPLEFLQARGIAPRPKQELDDDNDQEDDTDEVKTLLVVVRNLRREELEKRKTLGLKLEPETDRKKGEYDTQNLKSIMGVVKRLRAQEEGRCETRDH